MLSSWAAARPAKAAATAALTRTGRYTIAGRWGYLASFEGEWKRFQAVRMTVKCKCAAAAAVVTGYVERTGAQPSSACPLSQTGRDAHSSLRSSQGNREQLRRRAPVSDTAYGTDYCMLIAMDVFCGFARDIRHRILELDGAS